MEHSKTMNSNSAAGKRGGDGRAVSSLSDFAEVFIFLQNLGPLMGLGEVKLGELENFFVRGNLFHISSVYPSIFL